MGVEKLSNDLSSPLICRSDDDIESAVTSLSCPRQSCFVSGCAAAPENLSNGVQAGWVVRLGVAFILQTPRYETPGLDSETDNDKESSVNTCAIRH